MKTILYTGVFRFPTGDAAAARVLNNAKILRDLGYSVVFLSWGGDVLEIDRQEDGYFYYDGFRYLPTYDIDVKEENYIKKISNHFFSGEKALSILGKMIHDVDIVIGYNPPLIFTSKILRICKKHKISYVSDITEWYDSNEFPGGSYAPPAWINYINMDLMQKVVKNKIVISSLLDSYYNSSNNIKIPPLVDQNESKWKDLKFVLPTFDGVRLVYAGNPGKKDLLETMLMGVLFCVNQGFKLQFIVVGVSIEQIKGYKNYEEILSLSDNFIFCGRVHQSLIPSYYAVSDFSIIIRDESRKNMAGFPTKLAESLTAGCPVLLNYTSDIHEFVIDSYNGFVFLDSSLTEFKLILSKVVLLSKLKLEEMKLNAFECAKEKFYYTMYNDKMNNFIKKLK